MAIGIRRRRFTFVLLAMAALLAIFLLGNYLKEKALHAMPYGFKRFNLYDPLPECTRWRDNMPATRDPATYRLYIAARKLWRSKIEWQLTREEATRILTDVRKAAELGDWGARALRAHFYLEGLGPLESNEVLKPDAYKAVEITRLAAQAMQPWGLYDLGVAYEYGYGGAHYDADLAWAYYLKAAQLGSPEAQMALASAYRKANRPKGEATMLQCAYEQGHGPAAYKLAMDAGVSKRYREAIGFYQEGVKFGSIECARDLEVMFRHGYWGRGSDEEKEILKSFGVGVDEERTRRYTIIYDALQINPDLKLGRLDHVLPLPPAKLPAWSGVEDAVTPESTGRPTY